MPGVFRFRPSFRLVALALLAWTVAAFAIACFVVAGLFAYNSASPREPWEPSLPKPVSILIGKQDPDVRIRRKDLTCAMVSGEGRMHCGATFEGHLRETTVMLEDYGLLCDASYAGKVVPCWASWNIHQQSYVVLESDLGLDGARFQQLVDQTANVGWGEADWIRLAAGIAIGIGAITAVSLWGHSGQVKGTALSAGWSSLITVLRLICAAGAGLMVFEVSISASIPILGLLRLID